MGIVYKDNDELNKALSMYKLALAINQSLGSKEGMADNYGNMGNVYRINGELDQAWLVYNQALEINKTLGRKSAMAAVEYILIVVQRLLMAQQFALGLMLRLHFLSCGSCFPYSLQ